jgi:chemotaxis protein CheX
VSFKAESVGKELLVIHFSETVDDLDIQKFQLLSSDWLSSEAEKIVFDLSKAEQFSEKMYRIVAQFFQSLRKANKSLYTIGVSDSLRRKLQSDGVSDMFNVKPSLDAVIKHSSKVASNIKSEFVSAIASAVIEIFKVQASTEVKVLKPKLKSEVGNSTYNVISVVSLQSDQFQGTVALCFPKQTYLRVYNEMLAESVTEINDENRDAAGELLNMVFGMAKSKVMNEKNLSIDKAIPTILSGDNITMQANSSEVGLVIPMQSSAGPLAVEVAFSVNNK